MANRRFDSGYCIGVRLISIPGSFQTLAGAGTVVASQVKGFGFGYAPVNGVMALQSAARPGISSTPGIVRTATGTYTITLDDSYADLVEMGTDLQVPSASANWAQPGPSSNLGVSGVAPTFTVLLINSSGTLVDPGATSRVNFSLTLRDSTTQFGKP